MIPFTFMPQLIILFQLILPVMLFLMGVERKSHFLLRVMGSLLFSVLLLDLYITLPVIINSMVKSILSYFITYFMVVLFAWFAYKISVVTVIFISSCSYALQHISFCLSRMLLENTNYETAAILFSVVLQVFLCLIFYFAVLRKNEYVYRNADYRQVFLSMVLLFICIMLNSLRSKEAGGVIYANLYDLLLCGCCLMLQFSMSYSTKIYEENKTLELLINQQHEQHKLSKQAFDMMNLKIHNIRHQLTDIQRMMEEKDGEKLRPFMRTLQIYDTMANTGNATLDAVLMEKGLMCEINDIRFSFIVDGKQLGFMETADLFSMINNILDNAIENEMKEEKRERRIINLRIVRSHDMILLDAENYCRYPVDMQDDIIQTTKSDKENHGLGIRGIEYVVKKYDGNLTFSQEDNIFRVGIILPIRN
ncbi:MAG: ATP-binding protein [Lachnospiraceae bacterium]|nr:ATP-binding protein [Lachnospiraceae bacterium]MDD3794922.1 ATP-binding protein [Lachnospiraceae bacterium]